MGFNFCVFRDANLGRESYFHIDFVERSVLFQVYKRFLTRGEAEERNVVTISLFKASQTPTEIFQLLFHHLPFREANKEAAMAVEDTEGRKRKPYHQFSGHPDILVFVISSNHRGCWRISKTTHVYTLLKI